MNQCTFTSADLDVLPFRMGLLGLTEWECSRQVWEEHDEVSDRCVWHADTADKPPADLANTVEGGDLNGAIVPSETDLSGVSFPDGTELVDADLSGANLWEAALPEATLSSADLSEADLREADLSEAYLREADLSEADLREADLEEAFLVRADLSGADLARAALSEAELWRADLPGADLRGANLSEAKLAYADLSEAKLHTADLSGAYLEDANLSKANLKDADLSGANLRRADLPEANLKDADLSGADLRSADLSEAVLAGTSLSSAALSRATDIDSPGKQIRQESVDTPEERVYDSIARANHELREAYSSNGLISRARDARFRERKARRKEAKAEGGEGRLAWAGSLLSMCFTGYGVRLWYVVGSMLALYLGSAFVYWQWGEMWWGRSLYYSVVTFTTSPPETPSGTIPSVVAGFETFAGTAAIIFLGYVLGTRERV